MKMAVVPARSGSTRLKDKNIYPLSGKPLIRWIVESIIETNIFDRVVISTDGDRIFESVSDLGVERHYRDPHHATVEATVLDAMVDFMKKQPSCGEGDIFSYFLPTCPLVSPDDICKGIETLVSECDSVVSMTEYSETIQLACSMKDDWVLPVFDNLECGMTNSKFIKKYYRPSGAFYIGKWDKILENKNFFKGNVKGVLIPHERSVDINDVRDIEYAESILRARQR